MSVLVGASRAPEIRVQRSAGGTPAHALQRVAPRNSSYRAPTCSTFDANDRAQKSARPASAQPSYTFGARGGYDPNALAYGSSRRDTKWMTSAPPPRRQQQQSAWSESGASVVTDGVYEAPAVRLGERYELADGAPVYPTDRWRDGYGRPASAAAARHRVHWEEGDPGDYCVDLPCSHRTHGSESLRSCAMLRLSLSPFSPTSSVRRCRRPARLMVDHQAAAEERQKLQVDIM